MTKELQEAIQITRELAALLKAQMAFDFGTAPAPTRPTTTANPHHRAYTRRNASGTVSQIQARGAQTPDHHAMVKELHDAYERHDRPAHQEMTTAELQRIVETREASTEDFIRGMQPGEKTTLTWSDGKKQTITIKAADEPVTVQPAVPHAGHRIPQPPEVAHLITQIEAAAQGLLSNPAMAQYSENIRRKIEGLKQNPTAKHAHDVAADLKLMAEKASEQTATPDRRAARGLKEVLESDDFGMTENGGNGRVKLNRDGTLTVYDSYAIGGDEALQNMIKKWSPGEFYNNYFKGEGYEIKVVGHDKEMRSAMFRGHGSVSVTLAVTKTEQAPGPRAPRTPPAAKPEPFLGDAKGLIKDIVGKMNITYGYGPHEQPLNIRVRHDQNMVTVSYKTDSFPGFAVGMNGQIMEQEKAAFAAAAPRILAEVKKRINVEDSSIEPDSLFFVSDDMIPSRRLPSNPDPDRVLHGEGRSAIKQAYVDKVSAEIKRIKGLSREDLVREIRFQSRLDLGQMRSESLGDLRMHALHHKYDGPRLQSYYDYANANKRLRLPLL